VCVCVYDGVSKTVINEVTCFNFATDAFTFYQELLHVKCISRTIVPTEEANLNIKPPLGLLCHPPFEQIHISFTKCDKITFIQSRAFISTGNVIYFYGTADVHFSLEWILLYAV
jgi:hypothetical protein